MQDKREIGYCIDRLEKIQYFKKRVINTIIERVTKLKYISNLENRIILRLFVCGQLIRERMAEQANGMQSRN